LDYTTSATENAKCCEANHYDFAGISSEIQCSEQLLALRFRNGDAATARISTMLGRLPKFDVTFE
jgi:hypothetical protein